MRIEGRRIILSRRNLLTLLYKLEREDSARTIEKDGWYVSSEPDEEHYAGRPEGPPGPMHPIEEEKLTHEIRAFSEDPTSQS